MPNWCSNYVKISHEDPTSIDRVIKGWNAGALFGEFIPIPKELYIDSPVQDPVVANANMEKYGYTSWYDFSLGEWGTKWDVGNEGYCEQDDANTVTITFDTAWGPPVEFFQYLTDHEYMVTAYWYEPGMLFCGKFTSESGVEDYEITGDSSWVESNIPKDIDGMFEISANMSMWEAEENQEIELNDGIDSINE